MEENQVSVLDVEQGTPGFSTSAPQESPAASAGRLPAAAAPGAGEPKETPAKPNAAKADAEGFSFFDITIQKTPPEKVTLGVDLDYRDRETLEIEKINPGLIQEWNTANLGGPKEVKLGDRVVTVNGISKDASKMIQACRENDTVNMTIRRRK